MKDASITQIASPYAVPTGPTYETYSVLDVGKPDVPQLDRLQLAWLRLIHEDPKYGRRWNHLRWTVHTTSQTPVIVFDSDIGDLATTEPRIIGEACTSAYHPDEGATVAIPHFDIPCKASEQSRVRGEKALIGWEP
jgi:hypothetical protein